MKYLIFKQEYCTYCKRGEFFTLSRLGRGFRCNYCERTNEVEICPKTYTEFSDMGCWYCTDLEDHEITFKEVNSGFCEHCFRGIFL